MRNLFSLLFLFCTINSVYSQSGNPNLGVIPAPNSIYVTGGQFTFSKEAGILYGNESDRRVAELFRDFLKDNYFLDLPVAKAFIQAPKAIINFSSLPYQGTNPEGYTLSILPNQINVSGRDAGLFYGMETLMQMLPLQKEAAPKISCAQITDEPRYKYRGLHLDVGRHMFPVPFIKKYIDLIAYYKLNTFHWHLTEDQGWRIEIKKYPKLTRVGGFRDQTLIGHYHDRIPQYYDGTPYGGYYTQEEVKDIVAYAALKYVNVIPEIEMPGHSLAALTAYPQLGCGDDLANFKVSERWGVFHDIFCAGKEDTFNFLQDVLTEVMMLFPSQYIHIGGDEAPKTRWEKCKYCQKRIADNNLKDEHQLQSYFIQRIERFVNSKGRKIIGWDEILEGGLAPNATVMSWRGVSGGIAAAKMQHDAIMSPGSHMYFDHYQGNAVQEPVTIHGLSTLEHAYSYNPTPVNLAPEFQKYIIGVQANVWTEYMKTPAKVEYMILPRILSLSEIAWTLPEKKNFTEFSEQRVPRHLARIDQTKTHYRVPVAIGAKDTTIIRSGYTLDLKAPVEGAKIYYTINGYLPRETDQIYEAPVQIIIPQNERRIIKTMVITPSGKRSAVTTTIVSNESPLKPVNPMWRRPGIQYYYIPGEVDLASNLDSTRAEERGIVTQIDLSKGRNKVRSYGMIFNGYINIGQSGIYTFSTLSDDGSQLLIDDMVVVDNDGKHTAFELTGAVNLSAGFHKIQVRSFQIGGQSELKVFMGQPGRPKTEIPESILFY
ncbi:MAG TPA: family 20 glycosylhydrolase [Sphingobacteriaceae bacterium]|nr:family 20 glycosylhydrolase [Sphingobacteriaceae bacterium]